MRRLSRTLPLAIVIAATFALVSSRPARADDHDTQPDQAEPDQAEPDQPKPDEPATDDHAHAQPTNDEPQPTPDTAPNTDATDDHAQPAAAADTAPAGTADGDGDDDGTSAYYEGDGEIPAALEFDADGDGKVEPEEAALAKETAEAFAGISDEVQPKAQGEIDLANPGMTAAEFKNLVRLAKAKVLERLQAKMAKKQDAKMARIGRYIAYFSLAGVLLLLLPFGLKKKYPNKMGMLFKYSGLAALTFIVTVNFFGGVVLGMRTAQGAIGSLTNPQLKVAEGFFDTLAADPDKYLPFAKDLFAPTMKSLSAGGEGEQPIVTLLENGQKLMGDAKVFKNIAGMVKKMDFVFAAIPIVLLFVTMLLFVLAIKPTLMEIVKMPGNVAAGDAAAGKAAVKNAGRRVLGEVFATLCTVGVLVVLSLVATVVLGRLLAPALDLLIQYFATAVLYLQMQAGASTGLVFVSLFAIILFLALNLAAIILGMAFFLGKAQKVFQARFHDKTPLAQHARFWKWGTASVLACMAIPSLYILLAKVGVEKLADMFIGSGEDIGWTKLFVVAPLLLVFGFLLVFWAARGVKAIKFLFTYKVKPPIAKQPIPVVAAPGYAASMMPPAGQGVVNPSYAEPPTRPSSPDVPR